MEPEWAERVKSFLWLCCRERLLTNVERMRRQLINDGTCSWCRMVMRTFCMSCEIVVELMRCGVCSYIGMTCLSLGWQIYSSGCLIIYGLGSGSGLKTGDFCLG